MADRYLLETSATDGYLLEDGSGVLLSETTNGVLTISPSAIGSAGAVGSPILSTGGGVTYTCALVVADKAALTSGDSYLKGRIEAAGYTVTLVSDEDAAELTKDFVVLAESCGSADVAGKYKNFTGGVLSLEPAVVDDMDWATVGANNTPGTTIDVLNSAHDLAAGLSGTGVTVFSASSSISFNGSSEVTAAVEAIISVAGVSTQYAVYVYESGDTMQNAHVAEGRRVFWGLGWDAAGILNLNANGQSLLDAAIIYTAGAVAVTNILPTAIASEEAVGSHVLLAGGVSIAPSAIDTAEAVGSVVLEATASILASAIGSDEAVGSHTLLPGSVVIAPTAIDSEETIGSHTLAGAAPPAQTIIPTAIDAPGAATSSTHVQNLGSGAYGATPQTSTVLSPVDKTIQVGDTVVVAWGNYYNVTPTGVTDNLGNTYTRIERVRNTGGSATSDLWSAPVTNGGSLTTITVSHESIAYSWITAAQLRGVAINPTAGGGNFGSGTSPATWAANKTIPANGIAIGMVTMNTNGAETAGAASGDPLTDIELSVFHNGVSNMSGSLCYAVAGSVDVTGFNGTTDLAGPTNWAAAGGVFSPAQVPSVGTPTLVPSATITPTAIASGEALGTPILTTGNVAVLPVAIDSAEVIGSHALVSGESPARTIEVSAIASAEAIGDHTLLTGDVNITPTAISSDEALGSPTVLYGAVAIVASEIASAEALGNPTLVATAKITPSAIIPAEGTGMPSVIAGGVIITPTAIDSDETVGSPILTQPGGPRFLQVDAIVSAEAVGTHTLRPGVVKILPSAVASAQVVSAPVLVQDKFIVPTAIGSAESVSAPIISNVFAIRPVAISSAEASGSPTVLHGRATISPTGITTGEALGDPFIASGQSVIGADGVASEEAVGTPSLILSPVNIAPNGITTGELLGLPVLVITRAPQVVIPAAVSSAELFGLPEFIPGNTFIYPSGIESSEEFGLIHVAGAKSGWSWVNRSTAMAGTHSGEWPPLQEGFARPRRNEGESG